MKGFRVVAESGAARASEMMLPHGRCRMPMFQPVATSASLKGITMEQARGLDLDLVLCNTYHLEHRPGSAAVQAHGGCHGFMGWPGNTLTDSGGFQMVSLSELMSTTEDPERGVVFQSPYGEGAVLLTPESSTQSQNALGADIIMQLDDVVDVKVPSRTRMAEAVERSVRWLDRCNAAHARPGAQALYGIVQGGLDPELRARSLEALIERGQPGYAIGGLSGGESKDAFWRVVWQCTQALPRDKPRYLMGVGYPEDLVVCTALGVDQFDCVFPTRTARFGTALVARGAPLQLKGRQFRGDPSPLQEGCRCEGCAAGLSRGDWHALVAEPAGLALLSVHNLWFTQSLMRSMREALRVGCFGGFVGRFMEERFGSATPQWIADALAVSLEAGGVDDPASVPWPATQLFSDV